MKKLLISTVSVVALMTLAACNNQDEAAEAPAETPVEQTEQAAEAVEETAEQVAEETGTAMEETATAVTEAAEQAGEMAGEATDAMAETANAVAEGASNMAEQAGEMAGEAVEGASEMAEGMTETATEMAEGATDAVADVAENAANEVVEGATETAQNAIAALTGASDLDATQWGSPDSQTAFVTFQAGTIAGNGGCNSFTGSYEAGQGGALTIGALASTKMACAEEIMIAETEFLAKVQSAAAYTIDGDTLVLSDANGNTVATLNRRAAN